MKIIAFLRVYNEEDIIEETIEHLLTQGLEVVVLDNGSTDGTFEKCQKLVKDEKIKLKQIFTKDFNEVVIFRAAYDLAISCSPDWVVYVDADEILESGEQNKSLREIIEDVDSKGYNIIQFDRFDFFMSDIDNVSATSIKEKMKYYSYQGDYLYRAWKFIPGIITGESVTHYPIFPDLVPYKFYTSKLVLRHYTFRTASQAKKKIMGRLRKSNTNNNEKTNQYYEKILKKDFTKKIDHNLLTKYNEDGKWNYDVKYCPFAWLNPPKREDIFTEDGFLKIPEKTVLDYRRLLTEERSKLLPYKLRRTSKFINNKFLKKIRFTKAKDDLK